MRRFEHGGDIYAHPGVFDFSASLNPLGMPVALREMLRGCVDRFDAYPDPHCSELVKTISSCYGTKESHIVCTAGATDLIHRISQTLRPNLALVATPCYLGYEQALAQCGASIKLHALRDEDDYALTDTILQSMTKDVSLVFISNPNNPTGLMIDQDLLVSIIERAREIHAHLVLDESFIEFTNAASMISRIEDYPHLIIARSFTKSYAMAGLRLGYGVCADGDLLSCLREEGQPWIVSTPAQLAGCVALRQDGFIEESRAYIRHAREQLVRGLDNLGLRCIKSEANYIMFQCDRALYEPLLARGFLIRQCENFEGLDSSWYRVAVRTLEENAQLVAALEEVLQ